MYTITGRAYKHVFYVKFLSKKQKYKKQQSETTRITPGEVEGKKEGLNENIRSKCSILFLTTLSSPNRLKQERKKEGLKHEANIRGGGKTVHVVFNYLSK